MVEFIQNQICRFIALGVVNQHGHRGKPVCHIGRLIELPVGIFQRLILSHSPRQVSKGRFLANACRQALPMVNMCPVFSSKAICSISTSARDCPSASDRAFSGDVYRVRVDILALCPCRFSASPGKLIASARNAGSSESLPTGLHKYFDKTLINLDRLVGLSRSGC